MGGSFLINFITGFFKFMFPLRMFGVVDLVLPLTLMSDIHDWAGLARGFLLLPTFFINRAWIITMTRKSLTVALLSP